MTKKAKIITALVIGAIIASGIVAIKEKKKALAEIPIMKSYAMVVGTMDVKPIHTLLTLPYLATIKSDKSVVLSSRIAARVSMIKKSGDRVNKGDLLVQLDTEEMTANINAGKISLNNLLKTHKRTKSLYRVKGASLEQLQKEESNIAMLQAKLQTLQNQLSYATLISPVSGVIGKTFVSDGDMAMPGKPLLRLESNTGKYLLVRSTDNVPVTSLIYQNKPYPLLALKNTFNGLREYRADIATDRPDDEQVPLSLVTYDDIGTKIPLDALLQTEGRDFCFIVHGDKTEARQVKIVARGVEGLVVTGLKEGEQIVLAKPDILLQLLGGKPISVTHK